MMVFQLSHSFAAEPALVPFGETFVRSEAFKALFRDGMALIEDVAAYLDGDGRAQSGQLSRQVSLGYASESMRLTTRLMQIASWLLVQRAVSDGEISAVQAAREKDRVRLTSADRVLGDREFDALPERLRELVAASHRLHARVSHLDRLMAAPADLPPIRPCAIALQHDLLHLAFGGR